LAYRRGPRTSRAVESRAILYCVHRSSTDWSSDGQTLSLRTWEAVAATNWKLKFTIQYQTIINRLTVVVQIDEFGTR